MTRARTQNRKDHTNAVHEVRITESQRIFISWLLAQKSGLDKEGSRMVARIIDEFDLEGLGSNDIKNLSKESSYFLSGYEVHYIKDQIDLAWKETRVPPAHARNSLVLYELLTEALDTKVAETLAEV